MRAFHGDTALRADVRRRLLGDVERWAIKAVDTGWASDTGSLAASLGRSADLSQAEAEVGFPARLLDVIDYLAMTACRSNPGAFGLEILDAASPGVDLREADAALFSWLLLDFGAIKPALIGRPHDLAALVDLYGRIALGDPVDGEAWRDLAGRVGGSAQGSSALVEFFERLGARRPDSQGLLRASVVDWLSVRAAGSARASGWSEADERRAQSCLQGLWLETAGARERNEWPCLPELFREREPELAEGYERALTLANAEHERYARIVAAALLAAIRACGGGER